MRCPDINDGSKPVLVIGAAVLLAGIPLWKIGNAFNKSWLSLIGKIGVGVGSVGLVGVTVTEIVIPVASRTNAQELEQGWMFVNFKVRELLYSLPNRGLFIGAGSLIVGAMLWRGASATLTARGLMGTFGIGFGALSIGRWAYKQVVRPARDAANPRINLGAVAESKADKPAVAPVPVRAIMAAEKDAEAKGGSQSRAQKRRSKDSDDDNEASASSTYSSSQLALATRSVGGLSVTTEQRVLTRGEQQLVAIRRSHHSANERRDSQAVYRSGVDEGHMNVSQWTGDPRDLSEAMIDQLIEQNPTVLLQIANTPQHLDTIIYWIGRSDSAQNGLRDTLLHLLEVLAFLQSEQLFAGDRDGEYRTNPWKNVFLRFLVEQWKTDARDELAKGGLRSLLDRTSNYSSNSHMRDERFVGQVIEAFEMTGFTNLDAFMSMIETELADFPTEMVATQLAALSMLKSGLTPFTKHAERLQPRSRIQAPPVLQAITSPVKLAIGW